MSRHHPRRHFHKPYRRLRSSQPETTLQTAKRYGVIAVASGLDLAFGANAWDGAQERQASVRRQTLPSQSLKRFSSAAIIRRFRVRNFAKGTRDIDEMLKEPQTEQTSGQD